MNYSTCPCQMELDETGRERITHGTPAFPITCYQDVARRMDVPLHWHQEWEVIYIVDGSCVAAVGNQRFTLSAGEGIFINSGILHGCREAEGTGCIFHSIVFHPRLVGGGLDSVFHQRYIQPLLEHPEFRIQILRPGISRQKTALKAMEQAWQLCVGEAEDYEFQVRTELSMLILQLCRNMPAAHPRAGSRSLREEERIKAMLTFIHQNYGQHIDTSRIAASALISESECLRCFRSTISTTPIQYLKEYRIQQAAAMLTGTQDKVSDIAARCGFQDMSYFSKTFRQKYGYSPVEYRNR